MKEQWLYVWACLILASPALVKCLATYLPERAADKVFVNAIMVPWVLILLVPGVMIPAVLPLVL